MFARGVILDKGDDCTIVDFVAELCLVAKAAEQPIADKDAEFRLRSANAVSHLQYGLPNSVVATDVPKGILPLWENLDHEHLDGPPCAEGIKLHVSQLVNIPHL